MLKLPHNCTYASKMLKILQVRLQQYMNWELPDGQAGFRKGRGTRDQVSNIPWMIQKAREFKKNIYNKHQSEEKKFRSSQSKHFVVVRNLYAGQEATVRTGHGTTDWFQIGKGVHQGCILSPAYLTSMQSTSWETLDWKKHSWNQDCREKSQ